MLKLKLQYFGHLMWRVDSLEKTLMLGGIGGRRIRGHRGWDDWMASLTQWTWVWVNSGSWWWTGRPGVLWFMGSQRDGHNWATELNWTAVYTLLTRLWGNTHSSTLWEDTMEDELSVSNKTRFVLTFSLWPRNIISSAFLLKYTSNNKKIHRHKDTQHYSYLQNSRNYSSVQIKAIG